MQCRPKEMQKRTGAGKQKAADRNCFYSQFFAYIMDLRCSQDVFILNPW